MDEYIKKELAIKALSRGEGCENVCRRAIERILADDVAPVRHARWEVVVGSDGKEHMVCTGCRKQQDLTGVFSYCPNCGCLMDGGEPDA